MSYLINESTIRNFVGGAAFFGGLVCFACSSTYHKSFGKWDVGGALVYLGISLIICFLIWGYKRIEVPERFQRFQSVVETILLVAICLISVTLDELVPGKSDALSIISYWLFALTGACTSRRSVVGFETGFFTFFLSLFLETLHKTNPKLLSIGVVFGLAAIFLRRHPQSGSPYGDPPPESDPLIPAPAPAINATATAIDNHEYDLESQNPLRVGQDSGGSLSSTSNQENNSDEFSQIGHPSPSNNGEVLQERVLEVVRDNQQNNHQEETHSSFPVTHPSPSNYGQVSEAIIEETGSSFSARHHFPSNYGQVSEENITDWGEHEEDSTSSLAAASSYSSEQDHVSSSNYQNGHVHSSPPPPLLRRRRRMRMTRAIQNISSTLGDTLRRWRPPRRLFFFSPKKQSERKTLQFRTLLLEPLLDTCNYSVICQKGGPTW